MTARLLHVFFLACIAVTAAGPPTLEQLLGASCPEDTRKCIYHASCCTIGIEYCNDGSETCEQAFSDEMDPLEIKLECCQILAGNVTNPGPGKREVCIDKFGTEMWRSMCAALEQTDSDSNLMAKDTDGILTVALMPIGFSVAGAVVAIFVMLSLMKTGNTCILKFIGREPSDRIRDPEQQEETTKLLNVKIENQGALDDNERNEDTAALNNPREDDDADNNEQHNISSARALERTRHQEESQRNSEVTRDAPAEQGQGEGDAPRVDTATNQNNDQTEGSAAQENPQAPQAGAGNRGILVEEGRQNHEITQGPEGFDDGLRRIHISASTDHDANPHSDVSWRPHTSVSSSTIPSSSLSHPPNDYIYITGEGRGL